MAYYYPCLPRNNLDFFRRSSVYGPVSKFATFHVFESFKKFKILHIRSKRVLHKSEFRWNRIFTHHGTLDIFIFSVQLKPKLLLKIVWRIVILDLDKGFPSGSQSET